MRKLSLAATLALAISTPASAGFFDFTLAPYVGASAGVATTDSCIVGSCDDSDTAWKIYGGLEVNEFISMEVGYVDLGEVEYSAPATGTRGTHGMILQLVGTYAFTPQFTLIGRGGLNILNTEVDGAIANVMDATATTNTGDTDVSWSVGLGAQYNFTPSVGLRVEWERFFEVGDPDSTREADIDMVTAGIVFKF